MPKIIDGDFVVRAMLILAPLAKEQRIDVLRRSVRALDGFEGEDFRGEDPLSEAFLAGGPPSPDMTVMLVHPYLTERSDEDSGWITLSAIGDDPNGPTYVFLSIFAGRNDEQVELQWHAGRDLVARLVDELRPELGFMNGKLVDDEHYEALPAPADFRGPGLPAAITPWTYIDDERLDGPEVRDALRGLPVAQSADLAGGLMLVVVDRLTDPPPRFLKALERLKMRYIPPQVDVPEEEDGD